MDRYYPDSYEPFTRAKDSSGPLADWGFRRYMDKRRQSVMPWKSSGRLLDVGCATGEFLAYMAEHDWEVQGVEPSHTAVQVARQEYGLNVFAGDLAQAQLPERHFDVVTLWDVLEHLHDPRAELAEVHRILDDDGLLVMQIPNTRSLDAALFGTFWIGLDMPRHLYLFFPESLEAMLARSGFHIASRRCASGGYGAFVASLGLWTKEKAPEPVKRLVAGLSRGPVLRVLLTPYIYLAYALGRGPEITLFCRKDAAP
jgi:SAM-dependent methyltransferase